MTAITSKQYLLYLLLLVTCPSTPQPPVSPITSASSSQCQEEKSAVDLLWPTPVLKFFAKNTAKRNKALRRHILQLEGSSSGVQQTNIGGWQSNTSLFDHAPPAEVEWLRAEAYHAIFRYVQSLAPKGRGGKVEVRIGSAWANINRQGHMNSPHIHPGAQVSGVYYIQSKDMGSSLRFVDPRPQAGYIPVPREWTKGMGEHIAVQPRESLFVVFPSWLEHYVTPNTGDTERISVSFNGRIVWPKEGESATQLTFIIPPEHYDGFSNSKAQGFDLLHLG